MGSLFSRGSGECKLFGDFGWFIQGLLGFLSFSSLILKKYTEKPCRSWKVWFMDTSKQALSAGLLHMLNLSVSYMIEHNNPESNQCTWYFLNFAIDTLLGMAICYLLLNLIEGLFSKSETFSFTSGLYGAPPRWGLWAYQVWLWLGITIITKGVLIGIVLIFHIALEFIGDFLLSPVSSYPNLELMMVMIVIPFILNSLMFWITDSFLKNTKIQVVEVKKSSAISMELLENDDTSTRDELSMDDSYGIN